MCQENHDNKTAEEIAEEARAKAAADEDNEPDAGTTQSDMAAQEVKPGSLEDLVIAVMRLRDRYHEKYLFTEAEKIGLVEGLFVVINGLKAFRARVNISDPHE